MARQFTGVEYIAAISAVRNTTPASMACWFKPANDNTRMRLIGCGHSAVGNSSLYLESRGNVAGVPLRFTTFMGATADKADSSGTIVANVWQHACGVTASSASRFSYLNGTPGTENTTNVPDPTDSDVFLIGGAEDAGTPAATWIGLIAEVAIWNVALSAEDAGALAVGITPRLVRPQGLLFYAPLLRNIVDVRGGLTLTDNGPSVVADHPRIYY